MNTAKEKQVIIIAGANGSGKTTFAKKYLETVEEKYEFYKQFLEIDHGI
jgi:uridine kinase